MITYPEALAAIEAAAAHLPVARTPLAAALGAAAAVEVRSAVAVPGFANAAMDGFALRAADTTGAAPGRAIELPLAGAIAAGDPPPATTPAGGAWEIMTGAALPGDCDAVLPVERVERLATGRIRISEAARSGQNRREAGEDFAPGDALLAAGDAIAPQAIMALAAVGTDALPTRQPPRVALLTTGSELVATGLPGAAGRIRDVNGPYLQAAFRALGVPVNHAGSVGDDPAALGAAIAATSPIADIVVTTGGVSAGRLDFVPAALERLGARLVFHKVAIRPGKPLLFARLPDGPLVFGLPGNPMAVAVGLRFFVLPAIRALMGLPREALLPARAVSPVRARPSMTFFAKAHARLDADAVLRVSLLAGQESFRIRPLLAANCWAVVPSGGADIAAGDLLRVAPLLPGPFPAA